MTLHSRYFFLFLQLVLFYKIIHFSTEFSSRLTGSYFGLSPRIGLWWRWIWFYRCWMGHSDTVIFKDNKIYSHKVVYVNYTTYDIHWAQDSINPTTLRIFVMLAAHDDQKLRNSHPFWYAQVLGIFHTWIIHVGPMSRSLAPQKNFCGYSGLVKNLGIAQAGKHLDLIIWVLYPRTIPVLALAS